MSLSKHVLQLMLLSGVESMYVWDVERENRSNNKMEDDVKLS